MVVTVILASLAGLLGVTAWLGRGFGDRLPPGVSANGIDIGGLPSGEARLKLARLADRMVPEGITLVVKASPSLRLRFAGRPWSAG